jgi:hypothetical protein
MILRDIQSKFLPFRGILLLFQVYHLKVCVSLFCIQMTVTSTIETSSPHTRNYLLCDLLSFKVYMVQVTRLCNLLCCLSHGGGWSLEEWGEHLSVDERLRPSICVYRESLHESVTETEHNQSFGINRLVGWDKSGLIVTRSSNFQLDSLGDHVCIHTRNRQKSDIQHLQHLDQFFLVQFHVVIGIKRNHEHWRTVSCHELEIKYVSHVSIIQLGLHSGYYRIHTPYTCKCVRIPTTSGHNDHR